MRFLGLTDNSNNILQVLQRPRLGRRESINSCGEGKYVVHGLKRFPADVLDHIQQSSGLAKTKIL